MGALKKKFIYQENDDQDTLYIVRNHSGQNFEVEGREQLENLVKETNVKEIFVKKFNGDSASTIENKLSFLGPIENEMELKKLVDKKVEKTPKIYHRFFSISNNSEIFRLGKLYSEDIEVGMKYFCFASDGDIETLVKAQFGLVAYFNFHARKTITVLATSSEIIEWGKHIELTEDQIIDDKKNNGSYKVYVGEGIVLVDIFSFRSHIKETPSVLMQKFLSDSEIVFCSLPGVEDIEKNAKRYFDIIQNVDNITIVAKRERTSIKSIAKLVKRLKNYDVSIKGAMYE